MKHFFSQKLISLYIYLQLLQNIIHKCHRCIGACLFHTTQRCTNTSHTQTHTDCNSGKRLVLSADLKEEADWENLMLCCQYMLCLFALPSSKDLDSRLLVLQAGLGQYSAGGSSDTLGQNQE